MQYCYYPGCSSHSTGRAYEESVRAVVEPLGMELRELEDWNCCGATAYMNVNEILSFSLTARNLALAEKENLPVLTPCSACYTNLRKTNAYLEKFADLRDKVGEALGEAGMAYSGGVPAKHLLEAIVIEAGLDRVRDAVKKPLEGLKVAPYYGCQIVRPFSYEKDPENPTSLEQLLEALGATPTKFPLKTHCCGGSLMGTMNPVALRLCRNLLLAVQAGGADCIAVTCPLCQLNLDAYQKRVNRAYDANFHYPVLFFTQVMGMAFGAPASKLGIARGIVPPGEAVRKHMTEVAT